MNKNKSLLNDIDNRHVWIEVSSTNINILLQSNCGDGVHTIIDGTIDPITKKKIYDVIYHTETEYVKKHECPFCNPTSKIGHRVCKECAEQVIIHTIQCDIICNYIEDHDCNCDYCQILSR